MKSLKHYFPSVLFVGLLLALGFWILWTSLDFQECVKTYGSDDPSSQYLKQGGSRVVSTILTWRHCAGAYALDKNAVINAIGTVAIAIFTTILAVFTVRLAGSTRIAAEAANLNAEAVIVAERAYVFVQMRGGHGVPDVFKQMARSTSRPFKLFKQYGFANYGKTPAIVREIGFGACVAENLPSVREYSQLLHLPTHLLGPGQETRDIDYDEFKVTFEDADAVADLKATFWFWGNIVYDDMFGSQRTLDYVFHYSGTSEGFSLYSWHETDKKRDK